jgi:hypothetical protein
MSFPVSVVVGALLAGLFVLVARLALGRRENVALAAGLVVAALIYLAAALESVIGSLQAVGGISVPLEVAGVAVFALLAFLGLRVSPWFLAIGWAAHVLWDVWVHPGGSFGFLPDWYPPLCIGFDLVVAGYVALRRAQVESD